MVNVDLFGCIIVWRIIVGVSLIPAFGTLYQRLTLPESTRYIASRNQTLDSSAEHVDNIETFKDKNTDVNEVKNDTSTNPDAVAVPDIVKKKAHFSGKSIIFLVLCHNGCYDTEADG